MVKLLSVILLLLWPLSHAGANQSRDDLPYSSPDYSAWFKPTPAGYKKGGWKKPTAFPASVVRKAKYGDGVKIAIFDTAIRCTHERLKSSGKRTCFEGFYIDNTGTWNEPSGFAHGTGVAGVATGTQGYGVASRADIVGYRVFGDGAEWLLTDPNYESLVRHAVNTSGAKVINASYASSDGSGRTIALDLADEKAFRIARNKALVVKAAGNGNEFSGKGQNYETLESPNTSKDFHNKYLNNLIYVGALNKKERKIARWSDRPGNGCILGKKEQKCTNKNRYQYYFIVAPGYVRTTAEDGGYENMVGTSFSAPQVSGAAALISARWPKLRPHQVRSILLETATDMGKKGVDPVYGRGRLNITKALKPVRGRIGGVRVSSASVFNRLASATSFKNDPTIYDAFGRDFKATNYFAPTQSDSQLIHLLDPQQPIFVGISQIENENREIINSIDGISLYGFTYRNSIHDNKGWNSFQTDDNGVYIPATVAHLNSGNNLFAFDDGNFSIFIASPSDRTVSQTTPNTVGISLVKTFKNGLTLTNTFGTIRESGVFGLNSADGFGFEQKMTNWFLVLDAKNSSHNTDYSFRFENYASPNTYQSNVMSWSNINLSKASFDIGYNWGGQRIGVSVKSPLIASGQMNSQIQGLQSINDFYDEDEAFEFSYKKNLANSGSLNVVAYKGNENRLELSYKLSF